MSRRAPEVKAPVPDNGFFVAIPSYQRWTTIATKTLAVLRRQGVSSERVYIFVASKEEYGHYYRAIGKEWPNIVVGVLKLWKQRNFITRFFAEGTHVVSLDDDVEELYQCVATGKEDNVVETKLRCLTAGGLEALASDAKRRMQHSGAHLWSFNVSDNPFYMRLNHVTKRNGLCNGFFWGCLNRHSEDLLLKFGDGHEDVERSVRYFQKDGAVLRYRFFCAKTKCKSNRGGLQASMTAPQRQVEEDKGAAILVKEFPHLLKLVPGSILGLKFLSTRGPLLRSNVLSLAHFKSLAAQKRLDVLEGSVWACEDEDDAEEEETRRHFRGGVLERCQGDCICLRSWEPRGEGLLLGTSSHDLYAKMAAEEFHVLWMPEAACKVLSVEMKELAKGLEDLLRPWAAETTVCGPVTNANAPQPSSTESPRPARTETPPPKELTPERACASQSASTSSPGVLTFLRKRREQSAVPAAKVHESHTPLENRGVMFCMSCGQWAQMRDLATERRASKRRRKHLGLSEKTPVPFAESNLRNLARICPGSSEAGPEWMSAIEQSRLPAALAAAGFTDWPCEACIHSPLRK